MKGKIAIIGATSSLGSRLAQHLLQISQYELVLMARRIDHLAFEPSPRLKLLAGQATRSQDLKGALEGVDIVLLMVSDQVVQVAKQVVSIAEKQGVSQVIFVATIGIEDEIPAYLGAQHNLAHNPHLLPYRQAADIVASFAGNYQIVRPAWFDNGPLHYQVARHGQPIGGIDVSREAVIDLIMQLIRHPDRYARESIAVFRPE